MVTSHPRAFKDFAILFFAPRSSSATFFPLPFNTFFSLQVTLSTTFPVVYACKLWNDLIKIVILIGRDHSVHGSLFTENLCKCTGINTRNSRNIMFYQGNPESFPHSGNCLRMRESSLTIYPSGHGLSGFHIWCNSIISDQRICHNHCLSCIGRICENLKISCHRGIKYNFADNFARRTNALYLQKRFHLQVSKMLSFCALPFCVFSCILAKKKRESLFHTIHFRQNYPFCLNCKKFIII